MDNKSNPTRTASPSTNKPSTGSQKPQDKKTPGSQGGHQGGQGQGGRKF